MRVPDSSFYVTGGSLPPDTLSYVERRADTELTEALRRGEFCYVLTSRQMGKSSLMVRTAARLREEGLTVAVLDLTALGQNLSADQWYFGLLGRLGEQLDLEEELEEFWFGHPHVGPLQRWMQALRQVVLPRMSGAMVIFIDEIDVVRSLPFSTDELFAAIRECYNRRTEDPELQRLTFCLLGVAAPSDLIRDTRLTPFNIGRRIELDDFTPAEAALLSVGLALGLPGSMGRGKEEVRRLLRRVLFWTGGQPYLTQRLCQAVAEAPQVKSAAGVDRLCEELFLSPQARERDDNLLFVRERLLRSETDLAALLELYRSVREGKAVSLDETDPLLDILRLSGVVRLEQRPGGVNRRTYRARLAVRNRIYVRVFDRRWVLAEMPDAEVRRQKTAYRRGVLRTAGVAALLLAILGGLTTWALRSSREARRLLYLSNMSLAQAHYEADPLRVDRILPLLDETRDNENRAFEWGYWWQRCHPEWRSFPGTRGAIAPDGRLVVGTDAALELRDVTSGALLRRLEGSPGGELAFSTDGRLIRETTGGDRMETAVAWDTATGRRVGEWAGFGPQGTARITWAPDGKKLVLRRTTVTLQLLDARTGARQALSRTLNGEFHKAVFSPDGRRLVTMAWDGARPRVLLWDVARRKEIAALDMGAIDYAEALFSQDGSRLLTRGSAGVRVWDPASGRRLLTIGTLPRADAEVAISPDGQRLVIGGVNGHPTSILDTNSGRVVGTIAGTDHVRLLQFSPDGRRLLVCDWNGSKGSVLVCDGRSGQTLQRITGFRQASFAGCFLADGRRIAVSGYRDHPALDEQETVAEVWEPGSKSPSRQIRGLNALAVVYAPDRRHALIPRESFGSHRIDLQHLATGRTIRTLPLPGAFSSAAFASDSGTFLVRAADGKQTVSTLHETVTGRPLRSLDEEEPLAAGGGAVLLGSREVSMELTEVETGRSTALMTVRGAGPSQVGFAGGRLVTLEDRLVQVRDAVSGHVLARIGPLPEAASGFILSPDGTRLVISGNTAGAAPRLWDVETGRQVALLTDPGAVPGSRGGPVLFSANGARLVARGRVWDAATGEMISTLENLAGETYSAALSPDGSRVAVFDERRAALYDASSGYETRSLYATPSHATASSTGLSSPQFSGDGRWLSGHRNGQVLVFDVLAPHRNSRIIPERLWPDQPFWGHAALTPSGRHFLLGTAILERSPSGEWKTGVMLDPPPDGIVRLAPDGQRMATAKAHRASIWDWSGREAARLEGHQGAITCMTYSREGGRLATGSADGTARVWEAVSGRELVRLQGQPIGTVALSPDDELLLTSGERLITLWHLRPARSRWMLPVDASVTSAVFTADGRSLLVGHEDGMASMLDTRTGRRRALYRGHTGAVRSVDVTVDGRRAATGSDDGTVKIWDTASGRETMTLRLVNVTYVGFSPDGLELVTATGNEEPPRIWAAQPTAAADAADAGRTGRRRH